MNRSLFRNPRARTLMVLIRLLMRSAGPLLPFRTIALRIPYRWFSISLAAFFIGSSRQCMAQLNHFIQYLCAQPRVLSCHRFRAVSLIAQARAVRRVRVRSAWNAVLHGQVGRTFEPQVFTSRPHLIPTLAEFFVLRSPHLINPISQMLGDMEPVKADLLVGMGKAGLGRMNLRRPHIHLRIPCNWAGDHCGYQPIRVLFSRPSPTYSTVSALDTIVRYLWYKTSPTQIFTLISSFLRSIPRTPYDASNTLPANHIRLKIIRIPRNCICPRNSNRLHPMFRTLDPGNPCNQNRLIGTRIQMTPLASRTQILKGTYLTKLRTGQRRCIQTRQGYRPLFGLIILGIF